MDKIIWKEEWNIDNGIIDEQHKGLMSILNKIMDIKLNITILVVDDDEFFRICVKRLFYRYKYDIVCVEDGYKALNYIEKNHVDLVILDLYMPGMNGLEVLQKISERYKNIKVIIMTGENSVKVAVRAIKLGAVDFLEKPIDSESLKDKIFNIYKETRYEYINELLLSLMTYSSDHFENEETLMLVIKYPKDKYLLHKKEHRYFTKLLLEISFSVPITLINDLIKTEEIIKKLTKFCFTWLNLHFLTTDKCLMDFLKNKNKNTEEKIQL